jgi:hypothetical protein
MDNEVEWINAASALIASTPPDPKPLAALLRSGNPSPGICDLLADLLDPNETDYLHCKLELVDTVTPQKQFFAIDTKTAVMGAHAQLMKEGKSSIDAAEIIAENPILTTSGSVARQCALYSLLNIALLSGSIYGDEGLKLFFWINIASYAKAKKIKISSRHALRHKAEFDNIFEYIRKGK